MSLTHPTKDAQRVALIARILDIAQKNPGLAHKLIASRLGCSKGFVTKILAAAEVKS